MILIKYSDGGARLADTSNDIRGMVVKDINGQSMGSVSDFYYDQESMRVKFLEVATGGFLGLGEKHLLVDPKDATLTDSELTLNKSQDDLLAQPGDREVMPLETEEAKPMATMGEKPTMSEQPPMEERPPMGGMPMVQPKPEEHPQPISRGGTMITPESDEEHEREHEKLETKPHEREHEKLETKPHESKPFEAKPRESKTMTGTSYDEQEINSLIGQKAERRVRAKDGFVVLEKGDTITQHKIEQARQHDAMRQIMGAAGKKRS